MLDANEVRVALRSLGAPRWRDLVRHFGLDKGQQTHQLRRLLRGLERMGEVRVGGGRYCLEGDETTVGEVVQTGGKLVLKGSDVELSRGSGVRLGDRVEVRMGAAGSQVERVLEPSSEPLIGCVVDRYRRRYVESLDPTIKGRIDIEGDDYAARDGDVVEVVLLWQERGRFAGRIVSVLEYRDEADRAAGALLKSFRVPTAWPEGLADVAVPAQVTTKDEAGRVDLTNMPLVTIDGEDARDFDDAVYAERRRHGGWRLVVAIADVAHYVKPGSALDEEARRRGNSVYLPDRVVPMLPEALSNGICSLRPNEKRLALVCDMQISAAGRVSKHRFYDAVITSQARLTDAEVAESPERLAVLFEVFRGLLGQREARAALDFDTHESRLVLDGGRVQAVAAVRRNDAHRLIEEAMIAANVCAARHLEDLGPIYRVHEPPKTEKRDQLRDVLAFAGVRLGDGEITPRSLQAALSKALARSDGPAWILEMLVLRSLTQARYDPRNRGHFGLALPKYTHFTSPIRRYADLTVHRMIKTGKAPPFAWLEETGGHISMTERRAEGASRAVVEWLKCDFIADRIGEQFKGMVVGVAEFGLFVELEDVLVQGLVHVSTIGRDYYHFVPESMSLVAERSGERYTLGDELDVVLQDVSVETRRIDLVPVQSVPGYRRKRRR